MPALSTCVDVGGVHLIGDEHHIVLFRKAHHVHLICLAQHAASGVAWVDYNQRPHLLTVRLCLQ